MKRLKLTHKNKNKRFLVSYVMKEMLEKTYKMSSLKKTKRLSSLNKIFKSSILHLKFANKMHKKKNYG